VGGDGDHDVGWEGGEFQGQEEPDEVVGGCGEHEPGDGEHEEGVELAAGGAEGEEGFALVDIVFEVAVDGACEVDEQEYGDCGDDELGVGDEVWEECVWVAGVLGGEHAGDEEGDAADPGGEVSDGADGPLACDHDQAGGDEEDEFGQDEGELFGHGVASVWVWIWVWIMSIMVCVS